jgi:MFS family permease
MTPKQIIDNGAMHPRQWLALALTIGLNALDGFDVLSSAFAGPGIKQEWHLGPDGLGIVLAMELIGMGVGSLLLGGAADKYGRRPTILACLAFMAVGMFAATQAGTPQSLSAWRFLTGIGIGGMLSAINAVANEYSSSKGRSFAMALMVIGYPIGGFIGGLIVKHLLPAGDWRAIFGFGAWATVVFIPLVWLFIPETPAFMNQRRPAGALDRINKTLASFNLPTLATLPELATAQAQASLADIFKAPYLKTTILLSLAYAFHMLTFYYVLKMAPVIISDPQFAGQSFSKGEAAGVLAYANLGGALGGAVFGWFMYRHQAVSNGSAGHGGSDGLPVRSGAIHIDGLDLGGDGSWPVHQFGNCRVLFGLGSRISHSYPRHRNWLCPEYRKGWGCLFTGSGGNAVRQQHGADGRLADYGNRIAVGTGDVFDAGP